MKAPMLPSAEGLTSNSPNESSHLPWTPSWRQETMSRLERATNELDASIRHLQDHHALSATKEIGLQPGSSEDLTLPLVAMRSESSADSPHRNEAQPLASLRAEKRVTLEHFITQEGNAPPSTNAEILAFWENIMSISQTIVEIHETYSSKDQVTATSAITGYVNITSSTFKKR